MFPTISIICPTYNEEKYIDECIRSILLSDYPHKDLEVLFVDGMSTDATRKIILKYIEKHSFIQLIDNYDKTVPFALNKGIAVAKGEIIIRIDAHASYPSDYFSVLVDNLLKLDADNVGVVCKTEVLNKNKKTLAIKKVLSHPLGVGNSYFRTGISKTMEVDTVPFGCWKKEIFEKYGTFNTKLTRNQDIEFNKRIKKGGGKIFLIPDTYCVYYARENWKDLFNNNYQNGKWNLLTVYYTSQFSSLSIRHFIPLCFILSLLIPLILSFINLNFIYLSALSLIAYLTLIIFTSIKIAFKQQQHFLSLVYTFMVIHFSYGIGSLIGLIQIPFLKKH